MPGSGPASLARARSFDRCGSDSASAARNHCEHRNDQGGSWPELAGEKAEATDQWPELLDDSALWTAGTLMSDPKHIEKLQREQEGLRWNG